MKLIGKTILVTGATGGIGQALCYGLVEAGANLVLVSRSAEHLERLCLSMERSQDHRYLPLDIAENGATAQLTSWLELQQISVDVVINNAGTNRFALFAERSEQEIRNEIALNLTAPVLLTQTCLNWSHAPALIVNIGSAFAAIGYPGNALYCAAKAGLYRFSEALNREQQGLNREAITKVLYIAPRATATALNSDAVNRMNQELGNGCDTPEFVAQQVIQSIEKETLVKWLGWPEKLIVRLNQILPQVVSKAIAKQFPTIENYLTLNRAHHS